MINEAREHPVARSIALVPRDECAQNGNSNFVFVRFTRWSTPGVWDEAFETRASLGRPRQQRCGGCDDCVGAQHA
jgi:hypothetical protein